jgi:hypothetical protein
MRNVVIALVGLVILATLAVAAFMVSRPTPESPPVAVERVPIAPAPAPVVTAPKRSDLPTVAVEPRPVHAVPAGPPPPDKPITLRTQDGRPIDPSSGRVR